MAVKNKIHLLVFFLFFCFSCDTNKERRSFEISFAQLPCSGLINESNVWESTPFFSQEESCEWLEFPGKATLVVSHSLGRIPSMAVFYLSYDREGRSSTTSSGDMTIIEDMDDRTISVRNDTNEDFFLRISLL